MADTDKGYVLVGNIPGNYRTADLRRFFADHVENERFVCFHYRHRKEKKDQPKAAVEAFKLPKRTRLTYSEETCARVHSALPTKPDSSASNKDESTCCCIVRMKNIYIDDFVTQYNGKPWLDRFDLELPTRCSITKMTGPQLIFRPIQAIQMRSPGSRARTSSGGWPPLSRRSSYDEPEIDAEYVHDIPQELKKLPELLPSNKTPYGNVGTSREFLMEAIRHCRLSSRMIAKLELDFPRGKRRKYGSVPFNYGSEEENRQNNPVPSQSTDRRRLENLNRKGPQMSDEKGESGPDDDDDTCEEWERHEALHNDVQANRVIGRQVESTSYLAAGGDLEQQPGTKEKPFEEYIEQVWEKGRSGLNFYTDAQFWKAKEGDFDEQTADDWDVEMAIYYEKDVVYDKDAHDRYDMRRSEFLRSGKHTESVFTRHKAAADNAVSKRSHFPRSPKQKPIGSFEEFTRGIGGKIMKNSGWKTGEGLGPRKAGISTPIDAEDSSQGPGERKGIGFHGEKINFVRPTLPRGRMIISAYSDPFFSDPAESLARSNPPLYLKFRDQQVKFHSAGFMKEDRNKT